MTCSCWSSTELDATARFTKGSRSNLYSTQTKGSANLLFIRHFEELIWGKADHCEILILNYHCEIEKEIGKPASASACLMFPAGADKHSGRKPIFPSPSNHAKLTCDAGITTEALRLGDLWAVTAPFLNPFHKLSVCWKSKAGQADVSEDPSAHIMTAQIEHKSTKLQPGHLL